jgi:tricorn protease
MRKLIDALVAGVLCLGVAAQRSAALELTDRIYLGSRPSVSGDGKTFVFEWCDTIWMASTDGGEARQLQTDGTPNTWPTLSDDGREVAFNSERDGGLKVFVLDIATGKVRQVTFDSEGARSFAWVGKTNLLVLSFMTTSPKSPNARAALVPTEGRGAMKVFFDEGCDMPSLSPDGTKLLFNRKGDDIYRKGTHSSLASQIWLYDCATKHFTCLIHRDTESRTPVWAPDGTRFYYVSGQDGCMNLWVYDLAKKAERQLTFFKEDSVFQPTVSADGSTVVFRNKFDFYRIDPRESVPTARLIELTAKTFEHRPPTKRRFYEACWNNDQPGDITFCDNGMQIAFTTGGDLFVMDTRIRSPRLVHGSSLTQERDCVFARDGKALYYLSDRGDGTDLWKAEPGKADLQWWENFTFKRTQLTKDNLFRQNMKISRDGTRLSWQDAVGTIHIADTNGVEVGRGPKAGDGGDYSWSPDGKWIVAAIEDAYANSDIWIFPTQPNGPAPYNISRSFKPDNSPCWSPDGKLIAFSGSRPDSDEPNIFYVWLNPADELREGLDKQVSEARNTVKENATGLSTDAAAPQKKPEAKKEAPKQEGKPPEVKKPEAPKGPAVQNVVIDFNDLYKRVRRVRVGGLNPFFSYDSRTLAYSANGGTYRLHIPDQLGPQKMTDRSGRIVDWVAKGDRLLWSVNNLPAHFNQSFPFKAYQETDIADYQELAFLMAWGRMRDLFYDPAIHGADWGKVREKYRLAARYAPSHSVFTRVINMMLGEMNASHLGFYGNESSRKEWGTSAQYQNWPVVTSDIGLCFDPAYAGKGWRVRSVVPDSPADKSSVAFTPGDILLEIDHTKLDPAMDPALVLNGPGGRMMTLLVQSGTNTPRVVHLNASTVGDIRKKRNDAASDDARAFVHKASGGKLGYLDIAVMNWDSYYQFEGEIFSEGFDKDGMIIDVRDNAGGFTADRILAVLCGVKHSYAAFRDFEPAYYAGYWGGKPVFDKPIVVLCNEITASNGEIFTHAIKTLKRGKVVGTATGGRVIATGDRPLLDVGTLRQPSRGWFLLDGRDMEGNGAQPDVRVEEDLDAAEAGRDIQLEAAIETLKGEVLKDKEANPPVKLRYFR